MTDPPPYFTVGMRCLSLYASLFLCQTCRCCTWKNLSVLVASDQSTLFQSCNWHLANSKCFLLCLVVRKGFLLATLPMRLWLWRWRLLVLFETWWSHDATKASSLEILLLLSPFSSVSWGARCSCVLYPWGFLIIITKHTWLKAEDWGLLSSSLL